MQLIFTNPCDLKLYLSQLLGRFEIRLTMRTVSINIPCQRNPLPEMAALQGGRQTCYPAPSFLLPYANSEMGRAFACPNSTLYSGSSERRMRCHPCRHAMLLGICTKSEYDEVSGRVSPTESPQGVKAVCRIPV